VFAGHLFDVNFFTESVPNGPTSAPTPTITMPAAIAESAAVSAAGWSVGMPSVKITSNFAADGRPVDAKCCSPSEMHLSVYVVPPGNGMLMAVLMSDLVPENTGDVPAVTFVEYRSTATRVSVSEIVNLSTMSRANFCTL
jgi:hypothetical protein